MSSSEKFARQRQLVEIGPAGQERLQASTLRLSADLDEWGVTCALLYGTAAGMKAPVPVSKKGRGLGGAPPVHISASLREAFRHPVARGVGWGAATALASALDVLNIRAPKAAKPQSPPQVSS